MQTFLDLTHTVDAGDLRELGDLAAPVVSFTVPTARSAPESEQAPLHLKNLVAQARRDLAERYPEADADDLLEPVEDLIGDTMLWTRQAEGLVIIASAERTQLFRIAEPVEPAVTVGEVAHVTPLLGSLTGDEHAIVLAMSMSQVRLFDLTRSSMSPIDLGDTPTSADEMERQGRREPQLQHQHAPHSTQATYHGHSGATDNKDVVVDKFVLEVARGIRDRVGADDQRPMVLAAVAEHLPRFQATGALPMLADTMIAGNPDELSAADLHAAALPVAEAILHDRRAELLGRLGNTLGTGLSSLDPREIAEAAADGRVGTLLVDPAASDAGDEMLVDRAILSAAATSAELHQLRDLPDATACAAILRY